MAQLRRYELSDAEWSVIDPLLPRKSRGVPRVEDRRVLNGIFWRLRTGSPWADIPERYGPATTCYNRFVRWRKAGIWDKLLAAVSEAYDGKVQMIDSSVVRVHQHAANGKKKRPKSLHGPFPRRAYDQNPCARRCVRAPDRAQADRRPGARWQERPRHAWRTAAQMHCAG
jgi:transposase